MPAFKVISIKGASVRVRTGGVTFDVLVVNRNNKLEMIKPQGFYVVDGYLMELKRTVLDAYDMFNRSINEAGE
jgi:hypothetical protein